MANNCNPLAQTKFKIVAILLNIVKHRISVIGFTDIRKLTDRPISLNQNDPWQIWNYLAIFTDIPQ